ncbi:UDP-N-acetylmuramoyl-L-alanine--D-glutamate ligase [candidate division WOR-3 bacterium]|nr:UDP-N-acetylmuramoyl-L-alanine--D-glutamate ligase [candidate division WOR-3 bacterium]
MKILLLGLGRANLMVAEYLVKKGEEVFVYEENIPGLATPARRMIEEERVKPYVQGPYGLAITSPGFPPNKPICKILAKRGTSIIDEIEYVYLELGRPALIAVTGTNGKSTTAAMISGILDVAGIDHFLGGNIAPGKPFSHALFEPRPAYYVLEVSSFQLMRIDKFRPHIAVLTNIGVDHLNWHTDLAEYRNAKLRIFSNQQETDHAILNFDDEGIRSLAGTIRARPVFFGHHAANGVSLNGGFRYDGAELFAHRGMPISGEHNLMNMAAAIAVAKVLHVRIRDMEKGLRNFRGLPHRLEDLGLIHGVRYINNSMCTNASAALASFKAVDGSKVVILGGRSKGDEGEEYFDMLISGAKACVLLGENARSVVEYFEARGYTRYAIARDMAEAVDLAREQAQPGDVIFLNPGFASFDRFRDFEERGEAFRHAARQD